MVRPQKGLHFEKNLPCKRKSHAIWFVMTLFRKRQKFGLSDFGQSWYVHSTISLKKIHHITFHTILEVTEIQFGGFLFKNGTHEYFKVIKHTTNFHQDWTKASA
uniref:Uncharacterized protein n=1 Tax=Cacopsylla melanoneura TaxID=428564 RepID=A0A8D8W5E6_9HEMI